jgi:two-component sensor histidine kinase
MRGIGAKWLRGSFPLQAHLLTFALATLLPVAILAGVLLARAATLERTQLEARLIQVAADLADDVNRDIDRQITILRTLATVRSLADGDWPAFYAQAKAAAEDKAYVILIDATSLAQIVNTYVPYGEAPPLTDDPETVGRILKSKGPVVSDLLVSLVTKRPVYNVSIPASRDGEVRYVLSLGHRLDNLKSALDGQGLGPDWTTSILDRHGLVLARSRNHERFVGTLHPEFSTQGTVTERALRKTTSLEGDAVVRAAVRIKAAGWLATVSVPLAMAEAPLRRSLWMWGTVTALALILATTFAWLFSRFIGRAMTAAADAAAALGRDQPIAPLDSLLSEANAIVDAQRRAKDELTARAAHQRLLLNELSHRVKNVLAVVQSLIMRTLTDQRSIAEARDLLTERLLALGRAHEVLMRTDWKGASLRDIVTAEVAPFSNRVTLHGPEIVVDGKMVQTLALLLHELVTNAAKHGSLSINKGKVLINWSVNGSGSDTRFVFTWEEKDGPLVQAPQRWGFGLALLASVLPSDPKIKPRVAFEPDGFIYEIEAPLAAFVHVPE